MSRHPPRSTARQQLLENQEFLTGLAALLQRQSGSIYLTQKKLDPQHASPSLVDTVESTLLGDNRDELLFRATNGKDTKISTRVKQDSLAPFLDKYGEVCRSGMGAGLKKRDRKRTKKTK